MKGSVHYGLSHISQSGFGIDCGVKVSEEYSVKCSVQYSVKSSVQYTYGRFHRGREMNLVKWSFFV